MKAQDWIFSIRFAAAGESRMQRWAVVGPACLSTVEAALRSATVPPEVRAEIVADKTVVSFVAGVLNPESSGFFALGPPRPMGSWEVCIGSVQEVLR